MTALLKLPRNAGTYVARMRQRSTALIQSSIWEGMDEIRLGQWLNNFTSDEEQYFAACVLDSLIFRSSGQTIACMYHLFQRSIPDLLRSDAASRPRHRDWLAALRGTEEPGIRIVPVIRTTDPPTKSALLLARLYRRALNLHEQWMIWPWQIDDALRDDVHALLFLDDFLGTGTQFLNFSKQFKLTRLLSARGAYARIAARLRRTSAAPYCVYSPLVAHSGGIATLARELPELRVCAAERIDTTHQFFADDSMSASALLTPANARTFYETLARERLPDIKAKYRLGFGALALTFAFEHATPNNSLPILWAHSPKWTPLFER